ncbi:MAG TPA: PAS domain S-box protein [Chitinophagaceae bacterium]|nr:PAS domain S-box protein [Chitinophagaceae bacterium]
MKKSGKAVILVVDDNATNILALENLLTAEDRLLLSAATGEEALKLTLNKEVDLIILDVQLPGMDGFEVAQILKTNKKTKDIPIIFATAENKEHKFIMKAYDEGAVDYLFKPLDPDIVKAKVSVLLKLQVQKKELLEKNISLQKNGLLINNSADIIGIIDATSLKIEEINDAFFSILGYTPEETKDTALSFFLINEDRAFVQTLGKQSKERLSFETRIYSKDRSIKWLQWKVVVKNGKWFVNARDITEIKEVEKIRNFLATVVKQSNDAIYIHDYEGRIISWNEGAEKIYGYSEQEALKMRVWNIVPGYMQPEMEEMVNKVIQGTKIQDFETRRITKHGKLIDILFSASMITGTGNDHVSIAITERDITEQKIAAEQIKESEKRFRNLFEYAPYPMWVYDLSNLKFLEVNHTSTSLYEYSREEFLSMKITDIRPEEEVQKLMEHINQRDQEVQSSSGWKHRLRNGQLIDVEITSHLLDYKGHKAALVIAKDITERKKAEAEITRKNEELETANKQLQMFAAMAESSFDFVSMANMQGEIFYLNRSGRALMGVGHDEEPPKDIALYCDTETRDLILNEGMPAVIKQGWWKGEGRLRNFLTGELWDAAMRTFLVTDPVTGEPLCLAAIDSNITERKKAEKEIKQLNENLQKNILQLKEREEQVQTIFRYAPDAVVVIDEEGKITSWNPRAETIFGWPAHEVIGKYLHEMIIPKKYRAAHQKGLKHFLKTGEGPVLNKPLELSALKKDNSEFDAGISISPTVIKGKNYFIGFVSDITYRKKAEKKIEQANKELEKAVQKLHQVNKELESFSYSVSHDLRAPLRAINGYAKIIQEEHYTQFDDELKRLFSIIQNNAKRMGTLIDDLLNFSRLGKREVKKEPVDCSKLVREVLKEFESSGKVNAQLSVNSLASAEGDPALLFQVFANLISNAIKYSSKKEKPTIEIGSFETEAECAYYVKDNGSGFNMEYAHKLFGVFQRLHSDEEFEGTGVGLAIVQRIITKHGGRVWAEGQLGIGATFYFSLPKSVSN